jgi:hypothetical protein
MHAPGNRCQRSWPCKLTYPAAEGTACTPPPQLNTWLPSFSYTRTKVSSFPRHSRKGSPVCAEEVTSRCSNDTDKPFVQRSTTKHLLEASEARLKHAPDYTLIPVHGETGEDTK